MENEKKKILIVDDDNFLLDMYVFKFSQNNFEVHAARDGVDATDKLKAGLVPDIILLDIIMPNMDGLEMLEKIKNEIKKKESRLRELNSRPFAYKAKALTTELNRLA